MLLARNPAEIVQCGSRDSTTGDSLCNAITDPRGPVYEVVEVEATHDVLGFVNEHIENALTTFLLG